MVRETPEEHPSARPDSPTFTCEVCKISVRSAQKLLDHVNFSPLHRAALEGSTHTRGNLSHGRKAVQRRVVYDGTKLFWRINETLELCIFEDVAAHAVLITGAQQRSGGRVEPLAIESRSLHAALQDPKRHGICEKETSGGPVERLSRYILARLHAKKGDDGVITLFLQKLPEEEFDPVVVALNSTNDGQLAYGQLNANFAQDLLVRRRHTIDDVKEAQKGVNEAAVELKKARLKAENLSNLARMSLDALGRRHSHDQPIKSSEWLRVYNKVALQNALEYNKKYLKSLS